MMNVDGGKERGNGRGQRNLGNQYYYMGTSDKCQECSNEQLELLMYNFASNRFDVGSTRRVKILYLDRS